MKMVIDTSYDVLTRASDRITTSTLTSVQHDELHQNIWKTALKKSKEMKTNHGTKHSQSNTRQIIKPSR